jgi:hypothetical protein
MNLNVCVLRNKPIAPVPDLGRSETTPNTAILHVVSNYMTESKTVGRETTSIKVRPDLWRDAKIEAIRHGKTVSELVEEAIEAWVKQRKK